MWAVCYSLEQARRPPASNPSNTLIRRGVDSGRKADREEIVFRSNTRVVYASPHRQTRVPLEG